MQALNCYVTDLASSGKWQADPPDGGKATRTRVGEWVVAELVARVALCLMRHKTASFGITVRAGLDCCRRRRGPKGRQERGQANSSIARLALLGAAASLPRGAVSATAA
jgi:hypothetical protein